MKEKTGVEIYNTYGPLFKRNLSKAAVKVMLGILDLFLSEAI